MELGYAEKWPAKAVGVYKDSKMATKGQKMTHFREYHKIMKNNEIFLSNHRFMQKYSFSEVQETRNSKKIRSSQLYQAKNRSKIAKVGLKCQKSFKIQIFLLILLEKPKRLSSLLSYNLWNWAMLKNDQRKPWGASKDPKMTKKRAKNDSFKGISKNNEK